MALCERAPKERLVHIFAKLAEGCEDPSCSPALELLFVLALPEHAPLYDVQLLVCDHLLGKLKDEGHARHRSSHNASNNGAGSGTAGQHGPVGGGTGSSCESDRENSDVRASLKATVPSSGHPSAGRLAACVWESLLFYPPLHIIFS